MIDLLETDKIARVVFQDFCHQRFPVFPGMGTVLGQAEPEVKRHDGDRITGPVFVFWGDGYGGIFNHQDIECDILFGLSTPGRTPAAPTHINFLKMPITPDLKSNLKQLEGITQNETA